MEILPSARKPAISDDDIRHAFENAIGVQLGMTRQGARQRFERLVNR